MFFTIAGVERQCTATGISFLNSLLGPNVRPSLERACELRAAGGAPRFAYAWTVDDANLMREYIRIGVDGIITNDVARLRAVAAEPEFGSTVRRATRADDPCAGPRAAYGLSVHTGDKWLAGTDARVTFTLTGAAGWSCVTVDGRRRARMAGTSIGSWWRVRAMGCRARRALAAGSPQRLRSADRLRRGRLRTRLHPLAAKRTSQLRRPGSILQGQPGG